MPARWPSSRFALVTLFVLAGCGTALAQLEEPSVPEGVVLPARTMPPPATRWASPPLHTSLAMSFAALQGLDVASTMLAVRRAKVVEANPMMRGLVEHPIVFGAVRGALTAATLVSVRGLARHHPKAAALTLVGLNAGCALVVASNVRLATGR
ncbi:MAG: DUF5658 family protein [Vicinamibacterales bacterium]